MKKLALNYVDTFKGLSKEVWWLALITLINRAGTMVIPFLSIYLNKNLGFTKEQVGTVMVCFGLGSLVGSWLGGILTDKIGYYKVMVGSLVLTGILFFGLQFLETYTQFCLGIFIVMTVGDIFRPAVFTALNAYSKEENKTRSLTLIRLAINLGFSVGPAVGGTIIVAFSYTGLFWVDAITCIVAGILLLKVLHPKKAKVLDTHENKKGKSVLTDIPYLMFFGCMVMFSFIFVQLMSTLPLFYEEYYHLPENVIGFILMTNGALIFIFEMPLVKYFENKKIQHLNSVIIGVLLTALGFAVLLYTASMYASILIGMVLLTFGEMVGFPFSNAFAVKRAKRGNFGAYMGLYSMAFSIAHIGGHKFGLESIKAYGFLQTWQFMAIIGAITVVFLFFLKRIIQKEK
ncbi:MDR family MFS transporter [Neptunitalea lumnitzerae]|uniref:MFS transporter n=1 Tax=Neptunitalea lumnitzerae TaxID=2965509 RepID=A0ABQ5MMN2_9FLAO|nr:MFS transporter [Neptunitalea sp. Y10]GLB50613.1 MFS transporter [Neptunitalea sp. Y10]